MYNTVAAAGAIVGFHLPKRFRFFINIFELCSLTFHSSLLSSQFHQYRVTYRQYGRKNLYPLCRLTIVLHLPAFVPRSFQRSIPFSSPPPPFVVPSQERATG